MPPNVPTMMGCCMSSPSMKNPTHQLPVTNPTGDTPMPETAADIVDCRGVAQGKSSVGVVAILSE